MKPDYSLSTAIAMTKTVIFCLAIVMGLGTSCKKDGNLIQATVVDGGSEEVDGCGWLINVDQETYYPTNLPTDFQQNGKKIMIRYKSLNENRVCGFPYSTFSKPKIELLEIKNN